MLYVSEALDAEDSSDSMGSVVGECGPNSGGEKGSSQGDEGGGWQGMVHVGDPGGRGQAHAASCIQDMCTLQQPLAGALVGEVVQ